MITITDTTIITIITIAIITISPKCAYSHPHMVGSEK
jgi:ABC-type uncharacterized transport system substrate-binding protein